MKAIALYEFGGVDKLTLTELPKPAIQPDDVLIQVKAISTNPVDAKTRAGKGIAGRLKEIHPLILGWDISGVVAEVGDQVTDFKVGDAVFGMVNFPGHGKAYAEYVAAPASQLARKPDNISHEEAAATTLAALTAWQSMRDYVRPGARVLIHAAAGGVGHFAVQFAKHWGATVVGTSSAANRNFILSLGADEHIDYQSQQFEEATAPVDFVLDTVGGENIDQSLPVIKPGGVIISIPSGKNDGVADKAAAKGINGHPFMVQSNGADMKTLADLLEKGAFRPHIFKTYSFDQMGEAHRQQETGRTVGKLIVTV